MDKLQPQTVYVPVDWNPENPFILTDAREPSYQTLKEFPGVYPLTGKELAELLVEYKIHIAAFKINPWSVEQFLKSKGIEI